jgi:hypothetical protein
MVSKKDFKQILNLLRDDHDNTIEASKLGIDLMSFNENIQTVVEILFRNIFSEEQSKLIDWYFFENNFGRAGKKAWDLEGKEICKDFDEFWNELSEFKN